MKKYSVLKNLWLELDGIRVYRIKAEKDFVHLLRGGELTIKQGELGGYVESEENLSHLGTCWVAKNAAAYGGSRVTENAWLSGQAIARGSALLAGDVVIAGLATIKGQAIACDHSVIEGNSVVGGQARIYNNARITQNSRIKGQSHVLDKAIVKGFSVVTGNSTIFGTAVLFSLSRREKYRNHLQGE